MSDKSSSSEMLDNIKRGLRELIEDMRSRHLLLPAIALIVGMIAVPILFIDRSEPAVNSAEPPVVKTKPAAVENPIQITLITPTAVGDGAPLTSQSNPFLGSGDYTCDTISKGPPKILECEVSDLKVRVTCPEKAAGPPCGAKESGSTGGGGSSGAAGGSGGSGTGIPGIPGTGGSPGGDTGGDDVEVYVYRATVVFDGKTYKDLDQGDSVPSSKDAVATFESVNGSGTKAAFKVPEGSTVTGVTVDKSGLNFVLKIGQTAEITEASGDKHKLKLTKLTKARV